MFEAHPSIQRRTYEPTMASPPSFDLGGSTNHSSRDLRLAEPDQEVDRPIASQGIEIDRRSFCALPATPNPHNGAQLRGYEVRNLSPPNANPEVMLRRQTLTMSPQRGAKKFDRQMKPTFGRQTLTMSPKRGAGIQIRLKTDSNRHNT